MTYSGGCEAPATHSAASQATGGTTEPLPSNTASAAPLVSTSGSAARTLSSNGAPGQAAAAAAAAHGAHAGEHGVLVAVAGGVTAGARGGEQLGGAEPVAAGDQLGLGRPAAAHGHDEHAAVGAQARVEAARQPAAHRRLPHALAGADDAERRHRGDAREVLRPHLGVGRHVARAFGERGAHEQEALAVADHRLVREVDERVGAGGARGGPDGVEDARDRSAARIDRVEARQAELGRELRRGGFAAAQLLAAAGEQPADDVVAPPQPCERGGDHGRVVLAVDHHDGARQRRRYRRSSPGRDRCTSRTTPWTARSRSASPCRGTGTCAPRSTWSPSMRTML